MIFMMQQEEILDKSQVFILEDQNTWWYFTNYGDKWKNKNRLRKLDNLGEIS